MCFPQRTRHRDFLAPLVHRRRRRRHSKRPGTGANGVLYGTTQSGGAGNNGTVFSLTTNGAFQTLVAFDGTNGANPQAALVAGADGNLYGHHAGRRDKRRGTVFQMTTNGALTTLADFPNSGGVNPYIALVQAAGAGFYGAAQKAPQSSDGNIFEITPSGTLNLVYSFSGGLDGNEPIGALTQGSDGNFYGMTVANCAYGYGGIFKMSPSGDFTNLYSFTGGEERI